MHAKKYIFFLFLLWHLSGASAQSLPAGSETEAGITVRKEIPVAETTYVPQPVKQLLKMPYMRGATLALSVKDMQTGREVTAWQPHVEVSPASVMKTVTTATALEVLGEEYAFPTVLEYDGTIVNGILDGNLYIRGSGDPTLGSRHLEGDATAFLLPWIKAIRKAGIKKIKGAVIADESCFDQQGLSWKWVNEDLGSYYGTGSYGITVFDNNYQLQLVTGDTASTPVIREIRPEINLVFHNRLQSASVQRPEYYISGAPFSKERYLYGTVPANREPYIIKGDIPDPALFLAEYVTEYLKKQGIPITGKPACYRLLQEEGKWPCNARTELVTTCSPPLKKIVRITNEVSQNLYADILLKTLGNLYEPQKPKYRSSFAKGAEMVSQYWAARGLDISSLWMYDGSGLAVTDKLTAGFLTDLLVYMHTSSKSGNAFYESLPLAGKEGSVKNFLKGTPLQGAIRLKSGSMSRVRGYAGYVKQGEQEYAVALFINNYSCEGTEISKAIERLLTALLWNPL